MTHRGGWAGLERPQHWPFQTVLVTGARDWTNQHLIRAALTWVWNPNTLLLHGACRTGADALADECWTQWGGTTKPVPADWDRYGRHAGPIRNRQLADHGADMALAFVHPRARGTWGCVRLLRNAAIPTYLIRAP